MILGLCLFIMTGCARQSTTAVVNHSLPATSTATATELTWLPSPTSAQASPTPIETETPAPVLARPAYTFKVLYDPINHSADVVETAVYSNLTGATLSTLVFQVDANRYGSAFTLKEVTFADGQAALTKLDGVRLEVPLPNALAPGEKVQLTLRYHLKLPYRYGAFGFAGRQANLADWYPVVPPYKAGSGWVIHPPTEVGEWMVYEYADFSLDLTLTDHTHTWVVAGSADPTQNGSSYHFDLPGARNFTWVVEENVNVLEDKSGDVVVRVLVYPEHVRAGQWALQTTLQALDVYTRLFGPYPHTSLTVVESPLGDGLEYDGLFYLSNNFFQKFTGGSYNELTMIAAHETAHQWWYALVGNDQALEPWLDESLATYSELLFYENIVPDSSDWWWQYRVNYFNPHGAVNQSTADFKEFRPYINAVYLRGAHFWGDVRQAMGDDNFFAFLRTYAAQYGGKLADTNAVLNMIQQFGNPDLQKVMVRYFQ
jgi:hypothetical protein